MNGHNTDLQNGGDNHQGPSNSEDPQNHHVNYTQAFPSLGGPAKKTLPMSITKKPGSLVGVKVARPGVFDHKQTITIPNSERKSGGNQNSDVKRQCNSIQTQTQTSISYQFNNDNSLKLTVSGSDKAKIHSACQRLRAQLQSQDVEPFDVAKQFHKFILGKSGCVLRDIENQTNTKVRIPGTKAEDNIITISGSKQGIQAAKNKMLDIVKLQGARAVEKLDIPKLYHPFIAGPNNETKIDIENRAGTCKINIPPNNKVDASPEITVQGEKESVQLAVEMILSIYNRKKDKLTEISVEMPKAQHRHVVGPKAKGIHEILKKHGVIVDVPALDSNSEMVVLKGESANLGAALNDVYVRAQSYSTVKVSAPAWCMAKLIGHKGAGIKELNPFNGPEVFVKVDFKKEEDMIEISGRIENVEIVEKNIQNTVRNLCKEFKMLSIKIPQQYHGRVIGNKGANLQKLKIDREVNIKVPDASKNSDMIVIEGKTADVNAVHGELATMRQDFENEKETILKLDPKYHAYFFRPSTGMDRGKKEKFDELQNRYGDSVTIQFPNKNLKSSDVKIRGYSQYVDMVSKEVQKIYDDIVVEHYVGTLLVQKKFHRNIIGKAGVNIKKIKEECHVNIEMPDNKTDSSKSDEMIKVIGTKHNVELAKNMIRDIENSLAKVSEISVKIPKSAYKFLIGQKGASISVLRDEFGVAIQFPDENSNSENVIIRGDEQDVKKARDKLVALANDKIKTCYTEEVSCAKENRKFLVGRKGANRIAFQEEFGVNLNIPESENSNIVIIGAEKDVKIAAKELNIRIKQLNDLKEITTSIPKKYHKRLITDKHLHNIQEEYSAKIQLPGQHIDLDEVKVKGPAKAVEDTIKVLTKLISGFETESTLEFEILTKDRRALIGEQGSTVNALQNEFNVNISIKSKDNGPENEETTLACITGPEEMLECVKEKLLSLVTFSEDFELPKAYHGLLLGKQGQNVQDLSRKLHVTIKVPKKENENQHAITIRGNKENLAKAKAELDVYKKKWAEELDDLYLRSYTCPVDVPRLFHGKLIGQQGANIRQIQQRHDVKIKINQTDGPIEITGYQQNVHDCVDEITKFVDDLESEVMKDVEIERSVHNRIIGQRGRGVKRLMKEYNVEIKFPKSDVGPDKQNVVTVSGTIANVDAAAEALTNLENEFLTEAGDDEVDIRYRPTVPGQEGLGNQRGDRGDRRKENNRNEGNNQQNRGYTVSNAPWNQPAAGEGNSEAFPTLGNTASGGDSSYKGAWCNRR